MTVNAVFFVRKLSDRKCVTCIDVLQDAYGNTLGGLVRKLGSILQTVSAEIFQSPEFHKTNFTREFSAKKVLTNLKIAAKLFSLDEIYG
jgi:hypothetical protein